MDPLTLAAIAIGGIVVKGIFDVFGGWRQRKHERKMHLEARNARERVAVLIGIMIIGIAFISSIIFLFTQYILPPKYVPTTTVYYSAGNSTDWAYANQRKEFAVNTPCYVRIGSSISSSNLRGKGKNIEVQYEFAGTDICDIELAEGRAILLTTNEENHTVTYKETIKPEKKKNIETVSIFKYTPKTVGTVSVVLTYGKPLDKTEESVNSIYFINQ